MIVFTVVIYIFIYVFFLQILVFYCIYKIFFLSYAQKVQISHNDQVQIVHRKDHPASGKCLAFCYFFGMFYQVTKCMIQNRSLCLFDM